MTSLKRRFAMSSVVLATFALAGTTGLCAEDKSWIDDQEVAEGAGWGASDDSDKHGDLLTAYLGGNKDAGIRLRRIGEGAQPDVARIWKELSEADRWKLMALPDCVPRKPALSQAVGSLDADSYYVRRQAVRWLGRNKASEAKPRLLKKLHTEKSPVRYEIVGALAEIGGKDVVDAMIDLLAPDSWAAKGHYRLAYPGFPVPYYWGDGRTAIVWALGKLKAKRSAPAVIKVLQEKGKGKGYLGEFIVPVLGDLGNRQAIPELKAILATGEIAGVHPAPLPPKAVLAEQKRVKAKVNRLAARALLQLGDRSGCALLTKELANTDSYVRRFVAETFARFGNGADIPALKRCRTDKDADVCRWADKGLARISKERDRDPDGQH